MRVVLVMMVTLAVMLLAGCPTAFTGEPKVPNGALGCQQACQQRGMELVGMVVLGEYSDGCICQVPGKSASRPVLLSAAVGPAAVGVMVQMQQQARQQQQAAHH